MNSRVFSGANRLISIFLFSLLSACGGGSGGKSEIIPVSTAPPPSSGMGGTSAPDQEAVPIGSTANSSSSETVTQTDINASASQQEASSLNFNASSLVETALPDQMSSEQFEAVGAVHLIFKSG